MGQSAHLGVCSIQIDPLDCDGLPDLTRQAIVSCNVTQIDRSKILTDEIALTDPSGIPGRNCVEVRIDPVVDYYDITLTTCSVFDQELDALLGMSDTIVNAAGDVIGSKCPAPSEQFCLCDCGDTECERRVAITVWSMNLCAGGNEQSRQFHPDGRYWATVYPMAQFRPTADTVSINAELNGRTYTARLFANQAFGQGPGSIIPATEAPYDRCWYQFATDTCPPADSCNCLTCAAARPTPLAVA